MLHLSNNIIPSNRYFPYAKIGTSDTNIVIQYDLDGIFAGYNIFDVTKFKSTDFSYNVDTSLTVAEALSVDKKLDDGIANTGNIKAMGDTAHSEAGMPPNIGAAGCVLTSQIMNGTLIPLQKPHAGLDCQLSINI